MKTIALYSIKGGVGKTAAAVNLAYLTANSGITTLLIDLDPQSAATFYFRVRPSKKHTERKLIKGGKAVSKRIKASDFENLDLLPADFSYRNLDISLDQQNNSSKRLKELVKSLKGGYDYIFFDCQPNITLVSENVFIAADIILLPIIPTTLSMRTYETLLS
ncbi:MAG: AAA family ATPase, partial [Calditrichaceae bacterium]